MGPIHHGGYTHQHFHWDHSTNRLKIGTAGSNIRDFNRPTCLPSLYQPLEAPSIVALLGSGR